MAGPRTSPDPRTADGQRWDEPSDAERTAEEGNSEHGGASDRSRHPTRLPSWARFPRVAGVPDGPAFPPEAADASRELRDQETQDVLRELDQLHEEIRGREVGASPTEAPPIAVPEAPRPVVAPTAVAPAPHEEREVPDLWEAPSSYLEERLRLANAAARNIGRDLRAIDATWSRVVQTIGSLESEVARANEELGFIRSGRPQPELVVPAASMAPAPSGRPARGVRRSLDGSRRRP